MKFRYVLMGYVAVWIAFIICVCAWEWVALAKYQTNYTGEGFRKDILNEMKNGEAKENVTETATVVETTAAMLTFELTISSDMAVEVNGAKAQFLSEQDVRDGLYDDYQELTGHKVGKKIVQVEAPSREKIVVTNARGEVIIPDGDDYIVGNYWYDDDLAKIATTKFEPYLRHINKLADMGSLLSVMQSSSKAYSAVKASQQSLKWMTDTKSITFTRQDVTNMNMLDDNHFACDLDMDMTKISISSSGREIPVNETVSYRVLYEKVNGNWYIYSFITK